jgi:hypothetical protein
LDIISNYKQLKVQAQIFLQKKYASQQRQLALNHNGDKYALESYLNVENVIVIGNDNKDDKLAKAFVVGALEPGLPGGHIIVV